MGFFHKAPLFVVLLASGAALTVTAWAGRGRGYQEYDYKLAERPAFAVVLQGLHDGVYPWGRRESEAQKEAQALLAEAGETAATEAVTAADEAVTDAADEAAVAETTEEELDLTIPEGVNSPVVQAVDYGNDDRNYMSPEGKVWEKDETDIFASNGTYYYLQPVDDGYFADAIFIGDSRTEGLYVYSSMRDLSTFDAKDSVTIYGIYDEPLDFYGIDGTTGSKTAMEALQEKAYRKVYFSVGVNELGMPTEDYFEHYREFVQVIRRLQPDAIIYIEGIMHVTGSYAQRNSVYNNANIVDRNTALATLANGHDIFYLDMNSAVCDSDGNLPEEISYDGVHLKASAYEKWHQFLKDNAIVRSDEDWTPVPPEPEEPAEGSTDAAAETTEAAADGSASSQSAAQVSDTTGTSSGTGEGAAGTASGGSVQ